MYFNCAALQVVHFFLKDENLLRSYTATPKFFWTLKLIFNILLKYSKIYHSILLPSVDIVLFGYLYFARQCSDIISVVRMPLSSKFLPESTGE